jgi:hypothetical protein
MYIAARLPNPGYNMAASAKVIRDSVISVNFVSE